MSSDWIINRTDAILITGANGFVGTKTLKLLLEYGFTRIRCLVRSAQNIEKLQHLCAPYKTDVEFLEGTLFSREDCIRATQDVAVIYHLAVGSAGKSFPNAFMNAVIPTRNLLEASLQHRTLKRFVNVSSFAIYSNRSNSWWRLLDESCPLEEHPESRGDAYAFGKLKQDELVAEYGKKRGIRSVYLRPGTVYGPGKDAIPGRVGIDTFGIFMHLGGPNKIPFTYVENCAEAIILAGLVPGIDGEVFNVVDDDLPSSRQFLRMYKKKVKNFRSIYIPHAASYLLCYLWEKYSIASEGQLPPVFSRSEWHAYWKRTRYSNDKMKERLGWKQRVSTAEGLDRYFAYCRERNAHG